MSRLGEVGLTPLCNDLFEDAQFELFSYFSSRYSASSEQEDLEKAIFHSLKLFMCNPEETNKFNIIALIKLLLEKDSWGDDTPWLDDFLEEFKETDILCVEDSFNELMLLIKNHKKSAQESLIPQQQLLDDGAKNRFFSQSPSRLDDLSVEESERTATSSAQM